jgi:hypothetical protein
MVKLYHGSNMTVEHPRVFPLARALDFGAGFYLTSSLEQASRWATLTTKRRGDGQPVISAFELDEKQLLNVAVLRFDGATIDWLKFVSANRSGQNEDASWDVVIGPVANDNTMPVLNLYLKGSYNEEEALKRLLPQKLKDQYVFKTEKALLLLSLSEVIVP